MSAIDYVTFSISRTSLPEGSVCRINYTYLLQVDAAEYNEDARFAVRCELCGAHPLFDEELGDALYDEHCIAATAQMPVARSFLVPCTLLNERWGKDMIYLRLIVTSRSGREFSAESRKVHENF